MADGGEVDPDLVRPPGLQPARQPGQRRRDVEPLDDLVLGPGRLAVHDDGHLQRIGRVAPDRRVDDAVRRVGVPPHDGVVAPAGRVGGELPDQRRQRSVGAGDDEQAGAAGVEPVHDARTVGVVPTPASSGNRCSSPLTSVPTGVARHRDGRPARAACRRRSRRRRRGRRRTRRPGPAPGGSGRGIDAGSTSTTAPSARRTLPLDAGHGRRRRAPRRRRSRPTAADRLTSASRATTRSTRSPASAGGTRSVIIAPASRPDRRPSVSTGSPAGAGRRRGAGSSGRRRLLSSNVMPPTRDGDVGDVEDRPPLQVDEVDDAAAQPARLPEQPVEQVADGAADDQADGRRVDPARRPADRDQQADHDEQGDDADHGAQPGALREGHPAVEGQVEAQRPDDVDRVAVAQRAAAPSAWSAGR